MEESTYEVLLAEGYTPEQIEKLMELGVLSTEQEILSNQLRQAEFLRSTPTPRGRAMGRVYVAANPLEHLATGINRMRGEYDMYRYPGRATSLAEEQAKRRGEWLRGRGATTTTPAQTQGFESVTYGLGPQTSMRRRPI